MILDVDYLFATQLTWPLHGLCFPSELSTNVESKNGKTKAGPCLQFEEASRLPIAMQKEAFEVELCCGGIQALADVEVYVELGRVYLSIDLWARCRCRMHQCLLILYSL